MIGFSTTVRARIRKRDRVCVSCGGYASNAHHRRRRRENHDGHAHWACNGILLCGNGNLDGCHGRAHKDRAWAEEKGYRVANDANPATVRMWHYSRGWIYLTSDGGWVAEKDYLVDRCRHGQPEGDCASCAACAACSGECGTCPY